MRFTIKLLIYANDRFRYYLYSSCLAWFNLPLCRKIEYFGNVLFMGAGGVLIICPVDISISDWLFTYVGRRVAEWQSVPGLYLNL